MSRSRMASKGDAALFGGAAERTIRRPQTGGVVRSIRMKPSAPPLLLMIAAPLALALGSAPARADFEAKDSAGRRILLRDNGTWRYVDGQPAAGATAADAAAASAPAGPPPPLAELRLVGKADTPAGCRFDFVLKNTLPYEIRSLVPEFGALRPGGIVYSTQMAAFVSIKPGDERPRSVVFAGIHCSAVDELRLQGGDRCEMGELDRFSAEGGACLARLKVMPTPLVRFDKAEAK